MKVSYGVGHPTNVIDYVFLIHYEITPVLEKEFYHRMKDDFRVTGSISFDRHGNFTSYLRIRLQSQINVGSKYKSDYEAHKLQTSQHLTNVGSANTT